MRVYQTAFLKLQEIIYYFLYAKALLRQSFLLCICPDGVVVNFPSYQDNIALPFAVVLLFRDAREVVPYVVTVRLCVDVEGLTSLVMYDKM